jgi:Spy/CpxP family protein refolding chaperone
MGRLRVVILAAAFIGLANPWVEGQDRAKDAPAKLRGQLPQNWGKLGLTDEQKQRVYRIQSEVRSKVDALEAQIADLKEKERKDLEGVLTAAQKARLREILAGKGPKDK